MGEGDRGCTWAGGTVAVTVAALAHARRLLAREELADAALVVVLGTCSPA